jgi:iron-sulfur cluster repair protein YtfE (RIC family)
LTHIKAAARPAPNTSAMSGISDSLTEHHRQFERLIAAARVAGEARDWIAYRAHIEALAAELERHVVFEERDLFTAFERTTPQGGAVTAAIRVEHAEMRTLLARLAAAAPAVDPEGCNAELESLEHTLRRHAVQEEGMLYRACAMLPAAQAATLSEGMRRLAEPAASEALPELDVRGLEPPAPMMRIMETLARAPREPLRVRIHREPIPLYELLAERGFAWRTTPLEDGSFEVLIERSAR